MISAARLLAFETLRATFERGAFTERSFREAAGVRRIGGRERAQAQRLAYGAVQRRGTSDVAIERLAERSTALLDPPVLAGLRLGLYELLFCDATPDHAAVDQAVALVKQSTAHASGLVNAVLRRAAREREELTDSLLGDDSTPELAAIAHSAPLWLARIWWQELGAQEARALLAACNEPAEIAFRINPRGIEAPFHGGRDALVEGLIESGVKARIPDAEWPLAAPESIVLEGPSGDLIPTRVSAGELTPQSRGSAAVVEVLDPQPGERVLDLCAGPGTKTGQIAARLGERGEVVAIELDAGRAAEVAGQVQRLGLRNVTVVELDATQGLGPAAGGFDRVLLDAPCSDLGALASRPDARWRKSPAQIERLAELQGQILRRAATALRPGGTLVYSTCTISRRENEQRVAALLEEAGAGELPGLLLEDLGGRAGRLASGVDRRCLQLRPDRDRTTGFFICRMRRDD